MSRKDISNVERLVLGRLDVNARMPFSSIGKGIRKSQQQVSYTVSSLMGRGILRGFYTLIDYSKLDILNFRVYFKVNYKSEAKLQELIDYITDEPHTSWVATCGGRYDLLCTFLAPNPSQFNKTLRSIMERFPDQIQSYNVLTTIVCREFGRKYLFSKPYNNSQLILGGDREPEDIDETDMVILRSISEDARKSSVEISGEVGLTPKSVIQRIKRLKERKIIQGFRPLLNVREMNYVSGLLFLRYHNISAELENELISHLMKHPNVIRIVKTLGEWDIEIGIEAPDTMEFRRIEMELRQKFTLLIQQTETISLYRTYKKSYFPGFLKEDSN